VQEHYIDTVHRLCKLQWICTNALHKHSFLLQLSSIINSICVISAMYEFALLPLMVQIYSGLLLSRPEIYKTPTQFVRLYLHEASRVYADRLVNDKDQKKYASLAEDNVKTYFPELPSADFEGQFTCCHFANGLTEKVYAPVTTLPALSKVL